MRISYSTIQADVKFTTFNKQCDMKHKRSSVAIRFLRLNHNFAKITSTKLTSWTSFYVLLNRASMSWFDFRKVFRSGRPSWQKQENNVETVSLVVKAEKYNKTC